jgi:hypothetical protein
MPLVNSDDYLFSFFADTYQLLSELGFEESFVTLTKLDDVLVIEVLVMLDEVSDFVYSEVLP